MWLSECFVWEAPWEEKLSEPFGGHSWCTAQRDHLEYLPLPHHHPQNEFGI